MRKVTDLPARVIGETGNLHPVRGASWPWSRTLVAGATGIVLTIARASGELDRQSFAHELGSVFFVARGISHRKQQRVASKERVHGIGPRRTECCATTC